MRPTPLVLSVVAGALAASASPRAEACAVGLVVAEGTTVTVDSQLALMSLHEDRTDVVLLVTVPAASESFGALLPIPRSQAPTIDPEPVPASAFAALEERTRPVLAVTEGDGDGGSGAGCGCGTESLGGDRSLSDQGVIATPPVTVGPVIAQYVVGTDSAALTTWLTDNGYVLPEGGTELVDSYIAADAGFLAFKRSDDATGDAPASLGIHFSTPGDLRSVPLRIARLGAPEILPVTFFVAAPAPVGPAAPWQGILVEDLVDAAFDYGAAITTATDATPAGQLFVFETATTKEVVANAGNIDNDPVLAPLLALIDDGAVVSRLSARLPGSALASDVVFNGDKPASRAAAAASAIRLPRSVDVALLVFGIGLLVARRRRPAWQRP